MPKVNDEDVDLSMTLPRESALQMSSRAGTRPLSVLSCSGGGDAKTSPTTRRNMDAEIERLYRMCDNVERKLRSIVLLENTSCSSNSSDDPLNTNLTSSPTTTVLSRRSTPIVTGVRSESRRKCPRVWKSLQTVVSQLIDLSDSLMQTPDYDDDDVVCTDPVVDLCTPSGHPDVARNRLTRNNSQLSRRRLPESDVSVIELCDETPTIARKHRTVFPTTPACFSAEESSSDTESNSDEIHSTETTEQNRTLFMCPVCMESCLQRNPTATKCGHVFCNECIKCAIRLTHKCPVCNGDILRNQLFRIYL